MEPASKLDARGKRRLRQLLRRIGLQKPLKKVILQNLVRQHGAAVKSLPVVPAQKLCGQVFQQLVKLLRTDGLEQIIVNVVPDGLLRVGKLTEACQHDDDGLRKFFIDVPRQLQSVDEGHADIRNDHIRQHGFELFERLPAVFKDMRRRKAEFLPVRVLRHGLPDEHFIFHKHDLVHTVRLLCICNECITEPSQLQSKFSTSPKQPDRVPCKNSPMPNVCGC